ncbi:DUF6265 family protein [Allomuricauda sp. d1]|uniref:DUF6265 family protein n=1 Tax=Allomuricauda sp. d1 TaxID=3136725 RepID=UPI0031E2BA9A
MKLPFLLLIFGISLSSAQKTQQLNKGQASPIASLEDVAWIAGHWKGEAFGGIAEEIWSPPLGESMMFVFRLLHDGKVSFYEVGHIREVDNSLILQLKHFSGDLKGWETKDETVDFKLVKLQENKVFFEGFTMEKLSKDAINVYVLVGDKGKEEEVLFKYERVRN